MGYEAEPDTNGIDSRADVVGGGGTATNERLNHTRRQEAARLAQLGLFGHGDERLKKEGESLDDFVEAMLAASRRSDIIILVRLSDGSGLAASAAADRGLWGGEIIPPRALQLDHLETEAQ